MMDDRPSKASLGRLSRRLAEPRCSSLIHRLFGKPKTLRNTIVKHRYVGYARGGETEGRRVRATVAMTHDCS